MARLFNLARMTVTAGGVGTITLGVAVTGYLTFALAGAVNGQIVSYAINDPTAGDSEIGSATYNSAGPTLSSRTVATSTNSNNPISVATTAQVVITPAAEELDFIYNTRTGSGALVFGTSPTFTTGIVITGTTTNQAKAMNITQSPTGTIPSSPMQTSSSASTSRTRPAPASRAAARPSKPTSN